MYNWTDYVVPDNIDAFKAEFGVENFIYDIFANNEELMAKLQGGAVGLRLRLRRPRSTCRAWSRKASSRSSTCRGSRTGQYINPTFKDLWWDPNDEYLVPKDYGTTGIL